MSNIPGSARMADKTSRRTAPCDMPEYSLFLHQDLLLIPGTGYLEVIIVQIERTAVRVVLKYLFMGKLDACKFTCYIIYLFFTAQPQHHIY